jgi:cytidylate kinase
MTQELRVGNLASTLKHTARHWEEHRKSQHSSAKPNALTIALARETGTSGTAIAHEVGKQTGWPVYDHELVELIAKDMGLEERLLDSVDEKKVTWLQEAFGTFLAVPIVSESAYVKHLIKIILALGALGNCVIVGRGSAFILPAASTLRVRLTGPRDERIDAVAQRFAISRREAEARMTQIDREQEQFIRDHFLKDPAVPYSYDLVLNVGRFSPVRCAAIIVESAHQMEAQFRRTNARPATES